MSDETKAILERFNLAGKAIESVKLDNITVDAAKLHCDDEKRGKFYAWLKQMSESERDAFKQDFLLLSVFLKMSQSKRKLIAAQLYKQYVDPLVTSPQTQPKAPGRDETPKTDSDSPGVVQRAYTRAWFVELGEMVKTEDDFRNVIQPPTRCRFLINQLPKDLFTAYGERNGLPVAQWMDFIKEWMPDE